MAYESFGDFIQALDQAGELRRITEPVATELEITVLADHEMKKPGGGKALLIEKAHGGRRGQFVSGGHQYHGIVETHGDRAGLGLGGEGGGRVGRVDESQAADVVS
jgi:hypothetical protein